MKILILGMLSALVFQITTLRSQDVRVFEDLSALQFRSRLDSTPDAVLLDLRTNEEVSLGKIPTARQIDFFGKDFERELDRLDKNKTYFLYCASGGRSGETKEMMYKRGFNRVYNLEGGFTAWKNSKLPVESPKK